MPAAPPAGEPKRLAAQFIRAAFLPASQAAPDRVGPDEWPPLAEAAARESLAPLLHAALKALGRSDDPPPPICERLRNAFLITDTANWLAYQELGQVLDLFALEAVPVVLLKGCALAATLYPEPGLRPMGDLDVLIPQAQAAAAGALLKSRGFDEMAEMAEGFGARYLQEKIYVRHTGRPAQVDAHWHLTSMPYYRTRIPIEWFWERTVEASITGHSARLFAPEAQLLHLSLHFALHHWSDRLLWAFDLALLLAQHSGTLDWDEAVEAARRFGLAQAMQTSLAVVAEWWGVAPPPAALARLKAARPGVAERWLLRVMTARRREARILSDGLSLPGTRAKLGYWLGLVFPSQAYMRQRYGVKHGALLPAYYAARLLTGAFQLARSMITIGLGVLRGPART